jgi:hypothetical protein
VALGALLDIHEDFAWFVVVANAIAGLWALGAHWRPQLRSRSLWIFTAVAQLSVFAQVILGVALVSIQEIEAPEFHMFYGFVALATVGIIYSYRQQLDAHRHLLYGFGGLFLMGLGIRAMILG